jgi:copper chaperone CopZ
MISPNIVQIINTSNSSTTATAPILISSQYYRIQLNGLGCEACANRIKNTLNKVEWIKNTKVYFDNQTAIIQVNNMEKKSIENTIVKIIQDIDVKYSAQVLDSWVGYTK